MVRGAVWIVAEVVDKATGAICNQKRCRLTHGISVYRIVENYARKRELEGRDIREVLIIAVRRDGEELKDARLFACRGAPDYAVKFVRLGAGPC
jgi:hypothetical protein